MHKSKDVDRLVERTQSGDADAAAIIRRQVKPLLACRLRWNLQGEGGTTGVDQVLSEFLHEQSATVDRATLAEPKEIERLAEILTDRFMNRLAAQGAVETTVPYQRTVRMPAVR